MPRSPETGSHVRSLRNIAITLIDRGQPSSMSLEVAELKKSNQAFFLCHLIIPA